MPTKFDLAYLAAAPVMGPLQVIKLLRARRPVGPLWERLRGPFLERGKKPRIWVHAVSLGEVAAGRPLVRLLAAANPDYEVVVSASTETGRDQAARLYGNERTFPCPLDFSWTVAKAFDSVNPALLVLLELEVWPNLVGEAVRRRVPVAVVNGRITERSAQGYMRFKSALASTFGNIDLYAVQTEAYAERFAAIGAPRDRIVVTGSMKYDCSVVVGNPEKRETMRRRLLMRPETLVLVAGSTHPGEEQAVVDAVTKLSVRFPGLRLVLVPRHVNRVNDVVKDLASWGFSAVRKTAIDAAGVTCRPPIGPKEVMLVDTTGELGDVYHAADAVFVGGSLIPHGGQNVIEPAGLGLPVLWGPHTFNFDDAVARILAAGGGQMVKDGAELALALEGLLADPRRRQMMGAAAQSAIARAQGAAEKTAEMLKNMLAGERPVGG
ncbi:MAG TPA: glycosyltransferase N-terminal domain-containing protein [Planctomycetota bacterium]|nr:glycosyltransferase N-terminal domain-containing protein [Planctomycetota bacterium]